MDANIEFIALTKLSADPANVRKHSSRNLEAIKASLQRFGQQKPIVIDANNVVRAGNGTLAAARELGWEQIAALRTQLAGADAVAYAIADNRSAELAEWDGEALRTQVEAMDKELQIAAGFLDGEMAALLAGTPAGPPDESLEKPIPEIYELAVQCRDEADQQALFDRMKAEGRDCRVLTI